VKPKEATEEQEAASPPAAEPLPAEAGAFWGGGNAGELVIGEVRVPPVTAALPKRLGNFPFWRGKEGFLEALDVIYTTSAAAGMDAILGERRMSAPQTPGVWGYTYPRRRVDRQEPDGYHPGYPGGKAALLSVERGPRKPAAGWMPAGGRVR